LLQIYLAILDSLQDYHLKIQQIVASAVPKGIEIDLFQLSKAKLKGKNGRDMTDMEKIEMYQQRGIIIKNSQGEYAPGSNHQPIRELENGMARDVVNYLNLIASAKEELDEITGVNRVMTGGNLHPDTGKAVAQMQQQGAFTAIDYLHDADEYIFKEACKTLGILHIQAVKYDKGRYDKVIGKSQANYIKDRGITKHDFGYYVESRPSSEEWMRFYQSADVALQQKEITLADRTFVERISNLKKAQRYLVVATNRMRKYMDQKAQQDMQMNQQMQQQSNEIAHQKSMELEQMKQQTIQLQGDIDLKLLERKMELETERDLMLKQMDSETKMSMNDRGLESKQEIEVFKKATEQPKER
jgi:hypothetical protein